MSVPKRSRQYRIISAFVAGSIVIVPLAYSGGIIPLYVAIGLVWALMVAPAFGLYMSIRGPGGRKAARKFSLFAYILGGLFFSIATPVIAGTASPMFTYLLAVPLSLIVMTPSLYLIYRATGGKTSTEPEDPDLSRRLRTRLESSGITGSDVMVVNSIRVPPGRYVTHTDDPAGVVRVSGDARETLGEEELDAALVKAYYDMKNRLPMRMILQLNVSFMLYVDAIVIFGALSRALGTGIASTLSLLALAAVVIGFFPSVPLLVKELSFRKEARSDMLTARVPGLSDPLKSFIMKTAEQWTPLRPLPASREEKARRSMVRAARRRVARISR